MRSTLPSVFIGLFCAMNGTHLVLFYGQSGSYTITELHAGQQHNICFQGNLPTAGSFCRKGEFLSVKMVESLVETKEPAPVRSQLFGFVNPLILMYSLKSFAI